MREGSRIRTWPTRADCVKPIDRQKKVRKTNQRREVQDAAAAASGTAAGAPAPAPPPAAAASAATPAASAASTARAAAPASLGQLPDGIRLVLTLPQGQAIAGTLTSDWVSPRVAGGKS